MRLPWPFRREEHRDPPATRLSAPSLPPATVQRSEWAQLAPLDGLVRAPGLTAPTRPFLAELPGRHTPDPIIQRLGHHLDPGAPAGLVRDIAVARPGAATAYATGTPLVLTPPVQRAMDTVLADDELGDGMSPAHLSTPLSDAAPRQALPTLPPLQRLPALDLPNMTKSAVLTRVGAETRVEPIASAVPPVPNAQRSMDTAADTHDGAPRPALPPRPTLGQSRRLGLGPPLQRSPSPGSPAPAPATPPLAARGSPKVQRTMITEPHPEQAASSVPPPGRSTISSSSRVAPHREVPTPSETPPVAAPLPNVALTLLPLQRLPEPIQGEGSPVLAPRTMDPSPGSGGDPPTTRAAAEASPPAAQRSLEVVPARPSRPARHSRAESPHLAVVPIVSRSILVRPVQRAGAMDMPAIHRGDDAARGATTLGARAFTRDPDIYIPAEHGPLDRGPGAALLAHELTHVRQQRSLGDDLPAESTDGGQRLEAEARSAEQSYARPSIMSLPPATRPARQSAPIETVPGPMPTSDAEPLHGPGTMFASTAVEHLPLAQRADAEAIAVSERPDGGRSEEDLDDLARRLYGRLRQRLQRELLVDRERSGMVTDLR